MQSTVEAQKVYREFMAEPDREAACRVRLMDYLTRVGQEPVDRNLEELFRVSGSGICDRFNYLSLRVPEAARRRVLVSGCAAAAEMIIARQYGFQEIVGIEVVKDYVEIARERLLGQDGFEVLMYDGQHLPFASGTFSAVVSGHIIEHTSSPYQYLKEHVRVLAPGGILFLEFPTRYHSTEPHTGLPSLEYLPRPLRAIGLRYRASRLSSFSPDQRNLYRAVLHTLKPISVWQIKMYLSVMGGQASKVVHHYSPAPGIIRLLILKIRH